MGFSSCHPIINLMYFLCVLAVTIWVQHPVFLAISLLSAVAYTVKLNGGRGVRFSLVMIPCILAYDVYYSSYNHFGMTWLARNSIGNYITLEAIVYGLVLGVTAAGVLVWFSCIHQIFTTDKVVYLFSKISPKLSLFLSIMLRTVPRLKAYAKKLNVAQQGIGKGANQGNLWERICHSVRIFSMLITWTIEMFIGASESMQSRGSTLRGRTAYSLYRLDNRDRFYVVGMFACMTLVAVGLVSGAGYASYDPRIKMHPVTPASLVFYLGYAMLCLMPLGLDLYTEWSFRRAREQARNL